MKLKSIFGLILFCGATIAFAGLNDWRGTFILKDSEGKSIVVKHLPKSTCLMGICKEGCSNFKKGTTINGVTIQEDVRLCASDDIKDFYPEVDKLGKVVKQILMVGPTYND